MSYDLFYWPTIQGRGEFVRLSLEEAGAAYRDLARESGKGAGVAALLQLLKDRKLERPPFAPPILRAGRLLIGQTANILQYLGSRHGLAPKQAAGQWWVTKFWISSSWLEDSAFTGNESSKFSGNPLRSAGLYHQQTQGGYGRGPDGEAEQSAHLP